MESQIDPRLLPLTSGPDIGKLAVDDLRAQLATARDESTQHGTNIEELTADLANKMNSSAASGFATAAQGLKADSAAQLTNPQKAKATNTIGVTDTGDFVMPDGLLRIPGIAKKLGKWRAALAKTKQNYTGYNGAKLLLLGHSHIVGSGASNSSGYNSNGRLKNLATSLQRMFAQGLNPANANSIIGFGNTSTYPSFDTRIVVNNWAVSTLNNSIGGSLRSTTDGATIAFTPSNNVTTFELWYPISASQGQFNYNIDGGANTLVDAANATPSLGKITANVSAGAHTLNIIKVGTTACNIKALLAYNTSLTTGYNDEIQIIQAGHSGAKAADFAVSTNPWDGINEILAVAPDLTYIQISINDWVNATNVAAFKASVQLLIDAAKVTGDVILSTDCPSSTASTSTVVQMQYVNAIYELAVTNNTLVLDLYARLSSYDEANALGIMVDTLHGNSLYFGDHVRALYNLITTV